MLAFKERRFVRSAIRLIVMTMSPISSARLPISLMTPPDSAIDCRIFAKPPMDLATVAPPSRAAVLTRSATVLVFSPIFAMSRAVASSCVADVALLAARVAIFSALRVADSAARATCSTELTVASTAAAFFSPVAATSSTLAATSFTFVATDAESSSSCLAWSATLRIERDISSVVADVSSTAEASWLAPDARLPSDFSMAVTELVTVAMRSTTPWVSVARRLMPFDISSIVAPTSSTDDAFA